MLSKKGLIEYILKNGTGYTEKGLQALTVTSLVMIKVKIEIETQGKKTKKPRSEGNFNWAAKMF